ncbi:MAG: alpha/beta hydrolase [Hyphomicrobiaceae bacterium]
MAPTNWLLIAAVVVGIVVVAGTIVLLFLLFTDRQPPPRRPVDRRGTAQDRKHKTLPPPQMPGKPEPPRAPAPSSEAPSGEAVPVEMPRRLEDKPRSSREAGSLPETQSMPEAMEEGMAEDDIAMSAPPGAERRGANFTTVTVHFGTDRNDGGTAAAPNVRFGDDRFIAADGESPIQYGTCDVSIPIAHKIGDLEDPDWPWQSENPRDHVVLMRINDLDEEGFFDSLFSAVGPERRAFIFVHGFNVSFKDAARRTAQIVHDLRFDGAGILYSWPTEQMGWTNPDATAYTEAENNAIWSTFHFTDFLRDVIRRTDAEKIHLVAHSMGNRLVTEALMDLRSQLHPHERTRIGQVILTAADIDAGTFRDHIAPRLAEIVPRVSLYASNKDQALSFSESVHRLPRIGRTHAALPMPIDVVEVVDATEAETDYFGHDYYGTAEAIIADIYLAVNGDHPASQRTATLHAIDGSHWQVNTAATMDDVWDRLSEVT